MYGTPTDPTPYIALAYGLGALAMFGYAAWCSWDQKRLKALQRALKKN